MKKIILLCVVGLLMFAFESAYATPISLDGYNPSNTYNFNSRAGVGSDIVKISFDYDNGTNPTSDTNASATPAFRIRRLNDDGTDSWLGSFNIHGTSFNLDTTFGPYYSDMILTGENHFEFTMNQTNGLWDLAINGALIDFYAVAGSTTPLQPDGTVITEAKQSLSNKYFTDESDEAKANALALYPNLDPNDPMSAIYGVGVGGTGAYRLEFAGPNYKDDNDVWQSSNLGASVDNIHVTPEPATMLLLGFGLLSLAGVSRRKN